MSKQTSRAREIATDAMRHLYPDCTNGVRLTEKAIQTFAREMAKKLQSRARNFDGLNAGDAFVRRIYDESARLILDAAGIKEGR